MRSVLLIGQSNMAGRGFLHETAPVIDERIFMLRNGRWQMMAEPIHFDRSVAGVGPAATFAACWCDSHPGQTLGLIPCAEGGSAMDEWAPEGVLFRHAVSEARYAMERSELAAILWHQGESDSHSGLYRDYDRKLDAVVRAFRAALDAPEVPFLLGGLGDYLGKTAFGAGCVEYERIDRALLRYAEQHPACYYVTGKGLQPNPDGIHINAASQRRFGVRYFAAYRSRAHMLEPPADEAQRVDALLRRAHTAAEQKRIALERFTRGQSSYEEVMRALR